MKTTRGKKALNKFCPIQNCVTKRWERKPFYDEREESNKRNISASVYAYDKTVTSL
jgi:hypothetical protein